MATTISVDERSRFLFRRTNRTSRPLTAAQEAMFFGVTFGVAVLLHLAVLLNFSTIVGS